jgi:hypothetical protein
LPHRLEVLKLLGGNLRLAGGSVLSVPGKFLLDSDFLLDEFLQVAVSLGDLGVQLIPQFVQLGEPLFAVSFERAHLAPPSSFSHFCPAISSRRSHIWLEMTLSAAPRPKASDGSVSRKASEMPSIPPAQSLSLST